MEKIDSYARHFLILIALILGLSLVSEFRDLSSYAPSMINLACLSIATACTFASGITLQFKRLNIVTIILAAILISISVFFWIEFSSLALITSIFIVYGIITLLVCLTNLIFTKKERLNKPLFFIFIHELYFSSFVLASNSKPLQLRQPGLNLPNPLASSQGRSIKLNRPWQRMVQMRQANWL